jgi:Zn ribbon nucleic-acid-binding protein
MKECPKCGYVRQQKDDEIGIPFTECPRCGIIYDKINDRVNSAPPPARQRSGTTKSTPKSDSKLARYIVGALLGIVVAIAVIHGVPYLKETAIGRLFQDKTLVDGWYLNAQGYDLAVQEHNGISKPLLLYFYNEA